MDQPGHSSGVHAGALGPGDGEAAANPVGLGIGDPLAPTVANGEPVDKTAAGAGRVTASASPPASSTPSRAATVNRVCVRVIGPMRVFMAHGTRGPGACYGGRKNGGDDRIRTGE